MTATHKLVNGEVVLLAAGEAAAVEVEWLAAQEETKLSALEVRFNNDRAFRALCEVFADTMGKTSAQVVEEMQVKIAAM